MAMGWGVPYFIRAWWAILVIWLQNWKVWSPLPDCCCNGTHVPVRTCSVRERATYSNFWDCFHGDLRSELGKTVWVVGLYHKYWECAINDGMHFAFCVVHVHHDEPSWNMALSACWIVWRIIDVINDIALGLGLSHWGWGFSPWSERPLQEMGVRCQRALGQIPSPCRCMENLEELLSPVGHLHFSGVTPAVGTCESCGWEL